MAIARVEIRGCQELNGRCVALADDLDWQAADIESSDVTPGGRWES